MTTKETIAMAIGDHDHEGNTSNNDGIRWPNVKKNSNQKKPLRNKAINLSLNLFQNKINDEWKKNYEDFYVCFLEGATNLMTNLIINLNLTA
jgi:hypothetical protein